MIHNVLYCEAVNTIGPSIGILYIYLMGIYAILPLQYNAPSLPTSRVSA